MTENLMSNVRYGLRMLARRPGFTLVAGFLLALGIGATSLILSVVFGVLLSELPFRDAEGVVRLQGMKISDGEVETWPNSYRDYLDWRENTGEQFSQLAVNSYPQPFNTVIDSEPARVQGEIVNSEYLPLLGTPPVLGRVFGPEDDLKPGAPQTVVLSNALWQRLFGGARDVLGKTLEINDLSYEIIGVMPEGFRGISDEAELWLPMMMSRELIGMANEVFERRGIRWLQVTGRLQPDATRNQVQAALDRLHENLAKTYPDTNSDMQVQVVGLKDELVGDLRFPLLTLVGSAAFVLFIACMVVANLLLARGAARRHEIAVRVSQGATRQHLLSQLLTESVVLTLASAVVGLVAAQLSHQVLVTSSGMEYQSWFGSGLDPLVIAVVVVLAVLSGLAAGLVPAWVNTRGNLVGALREGTGLQGSTQQRVQGLLVTVEVALAICLLIGAGLMFKGFFAQTGQDLGFEPDDLLSLRIDMMGERYADAESMVLLTRRYLEALESLPGVERATVTAPTLPSDGWDGISHILEDRMTDEDKGVRFMVFHMVSPDFFSTLGIPLIDGRDFTESDRMDTDLVAVIDERAAREFWPGENPIGKRIRFGRRDPTAPWRTIVGVVGELENERMQELEWPGPDVYYPALQFPPQIMPRFNFVVEPRPGAVQLEPEMRQAMLEVAPFLPPYDLRPMAQRTAAYWAKDRFLVALMSGFAGIALLLAVVGLGAVISYMVIQRHREIGLRMALGGRRTQILTLILKRALGLVGWGVGFGLAAAVILSSVFRHLFYGLSPLDLSVYFATALILGASAALAAGLAARPALAIEPARVLREE